MSELDVNFEVKFVHRLRQTTDVAGDDFDTLAALLLSESEVAPKVQFWVDSNLTQPTDEDTLSFADRLARRLKSDARIELVGETHVIPGGESCKNSTTELERLLQLINQHEMDRRSYLVVAGGGAVLDVAGFAAATAHRGIRLIRLPSTTLAQGDSGVGVKNAVNYFEKKNWLGTFAVPWAVINDVGILESLPQRDFRSGFSEAIKVALLKSSSFFEYLVEHADRLRNRDQQVVTQAISQSCRWHLDHITLGGDPFESLEARPLDFGHWSAHRLEPMTDYQLRHGEAVGIGVALDCLYSSRMFGFEESQALAVCRTLQRLGTPLWCDQLEQADVLLKGLEEFRQHLGGRLTITMLEDVGSPINVHEIDRETMKRCISWLQEIARELITHQASPTVDAGTNI